MDELIYQSQMLEFIKRFPNTRSVMIPVHGGTHIYGADAFFQCRLFPPERANEEMETDDTNHWNGTSPGFTCYGYGSNADNVSIPDSIMNTAWSRL